MGWEHPPLYNPLERNVLMPEIVILLPFNNSSVHRSAALPATLSFRALLELRAGLVELALTEDLQFLDGFSMYKPNPDRERE
jgi:hypothetical protein